MLIAALNRNVVIVTELKPKHVALMRKERNAQPLF
jgi:hypothetical protein